MRNLLIAMLVTAAALASGCKEDKSGSGNASQGASSGGTPTTPTTAHASAGHKRLPIGEKTVGSLKLVATMDEAIKATGGGEGAFDLVITGGKPRAVRFWVGTENGEGSVKAKAEEETTDNWHTHAEVPSPLPPGSKFWAEVEPPAGEPFKVSFDLKVQ